jgi:hypothetical protein
MLTLDWTEGPLDDDEYSAYALLDEVAYASYRLRVVQFESDSWVGLVTYHANRYEYFDAVKKKHPDVETAQAWCETALTALMLVGTEPAIEEEQ